MNELMNKVDNLIESIDKTELVKDLENIQKKVYQDKDLYETLEKYQEYPTEELKSKIIDSKLFQEYKIKETELNLFIMEVNQRLKKISTRKECHHESN